MRRSPWRSRTRPRPDARSMTRSATCSMVSSMLLIRRGLKAADTMRRRRAWRGLSVEIMPAKYSTISGGQVGDAHRPLTGAVDLRVPADLDDVGVAGHGPVAGPGRGSQRGGLAHVGLLEEGQRALAAQQLEGALPLRPRPLPEGHGRRDRSRRGRARWWGPCGHPIERRPARHRPASRCRVAGTGPGSPARASSIRPASTSGHHEVGDGRLPVDRVGGPAGRSDGRPGPRRAARRRRRAPGGRDPAIRSRSHRASAGLAPPVETATITGPSRWTAGSCTEPGSVAVGAVDQDAGGDGVGHHGSVHLGTPGGRDHQVVAGRPRRPGTGAASERPRPRPWSGAVVEPSRSRAAHHLGGDDGDPGAGASRPRARRAATGPPPTTRQRRPDRRGPRDSRGRRVVGGGSVVIGGGILIALPACHPRGRVPARPVRWQAAAVGRRRPWKAQLPT